MTKKALQKQIDDQQEQINELQKRIAILEARPAFAPYVVTNAFPGSTTTLGDPVPFPCPTTTHI
jgi:hypothetical protein